MVTDGYTWQDPPDYWDNIVWPAYLEAHQHMLVNLNINEEAKKPEKGQAAIVDDDFGDYTSFGGPVDRLAVIPAETSTRQELFESLCKEVQSFFASMMQPSQRKQLPWYGQQEIFTRIWENLRAMVLYATR